MPPMKIIALFPIKNDRWILDITIPQLKLFADEILCLDGGSTDDTVSVLKSHGVQVKDQDQSNLNYSSWRRELLDWGRERGGTHFIWLDSDEAFTTNFKGSFREEFAKLKPGQKLVMQWLCLWKSPHVYREDKSIWSNLYKDFVFCDDGTSEFANIIMHEGRTPGPNNESTWVKLPPEKGAVLHFQFVPFQRFQIKQAFMRCRELAVGTGSARRINHKYAATLDDARAKTVPMPQAWIEGINGLDAIEDTPNTSYDRQNMEYFEQKGIEFFEPLQIWHIQKYRDMFVAKTGRQPHSATYPATVVWLNDMKNKIRSMLRK